MRVLRLGSFRNYNELNAFLPWLFSFKRRGPILWTTFAGSSSKSRMINLFNTVALLFWLFLSLVLFSSGEKFMINCFNFFRTFRLIVEMFDNSLWKRTCQELCQPRPELCKLNTFFWIILLTSLLCGLSVEQRGKACSLRSHAEFYSVYPELNYYKCANTAFIGKSDLIPYFGRAIARRFALPF